MSLTFPHLFQYVDLRTRYSELMTLTSQYIKFITETQRRLEDDEVITHKLLRNCQKKQNKLTRTNADLFTDGRLGNHLSSNRDKNVGTKNMYYCVKGSKTMFGGEANGFILLFQHITSPLEFMSLIPYDHVT